MIKIILEEKTDINTFNEPARELRVLNKPLWLHQRDILLPYCTEEREPVKAGDAIEDTDKETIIYKDNLFFDEPLFQAFIQEAQKRSSPSQIAYTPDDAAIVRHALPLQDGIRLKGDLYVADLYYYPTGYSPAKEHTLEP
jgi:hypothetical protein